ELAFDGQAPAMPVDDVLHEGEAQPCPALLAAGRGVDAVEALRQPREMLGGDAGATVADRELEGALRRADPVARDDPDLDPSSFSSSAVLDRVLDDVLDHADKLVAV